MAESVQFTINLNGNAYTGIAQLDRALGKFNMNASSTPALMERINGAAFKINNIFAAAQTVIGKVSGSIEKLIDVGSENGQDKNKNSLVEIADSEEQTNSDSLISINGATKEELMELSGIGAGKANAIIEYREKNGRFDKIEDIMNVSGIGESVYSKIKDYIKL